MYPIEMVPVAIKAQNKQAHFYIHLQVDRPNIALNSETYISLGHQEVKTCKSIGYEFYCEELFVITVNQNIAVKVSYILIYALKSLKKIAILHIILAKLISNLQCLMVKMKLFWQTGPTKNTLNVI